MDFWRHSASTSIRKASTDPFFTCMAIGAFFSATCLFAQSQSPSTPGDQQANLLTNNPGFEQAQGGSAHAAGSFPGWEIDNYAFNWIGTSKGDATEGACCFDLGGGGRITTAADSRASVVPGRLFEASCDIKKYEDSKPERLYGQTLSLRFYDKDGQLVRDAKNCEYLIPDLNHWQSLKVQAIAPANAVKAGVQLEATLGVFPDVNTRKLRLDHFQLLEVPEQANEVIIRKIPLCLEPGSGFSADIKYRAKGDAKLVLQLIENNKAVADLNQAVDRGRGVIHFVGKFPATLSQGNDYAWQASLEDAQGQALAKANRPGAFVDLNVQKGEITGENNLIIYEGRWNTDDPKNPTMYWGGSEIQARFTGTSLQAAFSSSNSWTAAVIIDGDEDHFQRVDIGAGDQTVTLARGLFDGNHSVLVHRLAEVGNSITFHKFIPESGKGFLRPEPLPNRKIEFYGDSITSGGAPDPRKDNPDPNQDGDYFDDQFRTFTAITSRALQADGRFISKGATGVSGSFVFSYNLRDYYNLLDFDAFHPEKAKTYDMSRWQPDAVVIAIGHNDQFRRPSEAAWISAYAEFVKDVRTQYPNAEIFCTNTSMSGNITFWQMAVVPLLNDPKIHFQFFLPDQHHGGHPRAIDHENMAYGSVEYNSLVCWIGDVLKW